MIKQRPLTIFERYMIAAGHTAGLHHRREDYPQCFECWPGLSERERLRRWAGAPLPGELGDREWPR